MIVDGRVASTPNQDLILTPSVSCQEWLHFYITLCLFEMNSNMCSALKKWTKRMAWAVEKEATNYEDDEGIMDVPNYKCR